MAKIVLHDVACSLSEQGRAEYIKIQDDISLPEPARNVKPKSNRKKIAGEQLGSKKDLCLHFLFEK